jgi:hypothetical protein
MAERTITTRNGALTNSDGGYIFEATPNADTDYFVVNDGWYIQPFMTNVFVLTDDGNATKIYLPNSKDIPVGHTIRISFASSAYATDEEFQIVTTNGELMSVIASVSSGDIGNTALNNYYAGEGELPVTVGDVNNLAAGIVKMDITKVDNLSGSLVIHWKLEALAHTPPGTGVQDVFDL